MTMISYLCPFCEQIVVTVEMLDLRRSTAAMVELELELHLAAHVDEMAATI